MLKKLSPIMMVVFAFMIYGCATTGTSSRETKDITDEKEFIKSDCAPNFSITGTPVSGKIYNAFKDYPNKSKEEAFNNVMTIVSLNLKGWQVINSDRESGLISASQGVLHGSQRSAMNIVVKRIKKDVRVEISRQTPPLTYTSTDGIMKVFCKIFDSI